MGPFRYYVSESRLLNVGHDRGALKCMDDMVGFTTVQNALLPRRLRSSASALFILQLGTSETMGHSQVTLTKLIERSVPVGQHQYKGREEMTRSASTLSPPPCPSRPPHRTERWTIAFHPPFHTGSTA